MSIAPAHWAKAQQRAKCLAAAALWLLVACGSTAFLFFYATTPTRWYQVRATELIAWRNTLILPYTFANGTTGRTTPLLSGGISFLVMWQWCGTLAVALGAAGILWIASSNQVSSAQSGNKNNKQRTAGYYLRQAAIRTRRVLAYRVPPRGLWHALLGPGGLSLQDLLLILLWVGLHIMWMHEMTMRVLDNRRANPPPPKVTLRPPPAVGAKTVTTAAPPPFNVSRPPPQVATRHLLQAAAAAPPPAGAALPPKVNATATPKPPPPRTVKPLPFVVQDNVAKYYGWVGRLDILLLYFPVPRCNFLHWLLDSDFPTLIKYHRWLGYGTILVYSLHGITYMGTWVRDGM
ncbi:hypothetical protein GPECTOR_42g830 [Gonium pectorale]|uniref:Ferric oxidoreductase domain-containing protein n=1 Tax=Gonium pectorale TaxID=33097 RepID=A0A150G9U7_GONPE|nr:hypothetical protein GPECTOR_42g830 [Gonium pectorale]|eukprot:KXZ46619.1 hypothetical protein GPECTOR_42g830 [Gonium pectorale]